VIVSEYTLNELEDDAALSNSLLAENDCLYNYRHLLIMIPYTITKEPINLNLSL